ncbi:MAG: C39 family peptidase [Patescibacteria group bacterium]|nr:C39 family peptidase [Patescibacteria group bacterium]
MIRDLRLKRKKVLQKIIIGFVVLATVFVFDFWIFMPKTPSNVLSEEGLEPVPRTEPLVNEFNVIEPEITKEEQAGEIKEEIKEEVDLEVPFTVQAPFAVWDDLHNEACEEATLIMAEYWRSNRLLTLEQAEKEIQSLVKWQIENWGGHYDLNIKRVKELAQEYFKMDKIYFTQVEETNDVRKELNKGSLVILPTAGRLLKNPYYKTPGPAYHMLVVKGYKDDEFITNDPGTKKGKDFIYKEDILLNAIHDWPLESEKNCELDKDQKAQEVLKGDKIMLVVEK